MATIFEYTTSSTTTLTKTSSELKAYDLLPTSVVKKTGSSTVWNISYSTTELLKSPSRINAIYTIFCSSSSSQSSTYNNETFTQLRIDFCIQPETYPDLYCPEIEDYNDLNTNQCSRLYSENNDFNNDKISNKVQCSGLTQYLDVSDTNDTMKTVVQNAYKKFCANNKTTMKECQCYNRYNFENYQNAKTILTSGSSILQSGNECCWYLPCQFRTNITVDPDIQNAYDRISCPSVCQNIIANINVKNVNMSNINLSNNCVGTSTNEEVKKDISDEIKTKEEATSLFEKEKIQISTSTLPPSNQRYDKNKLILILILVLILVLIIIRMIVLIYI